MYIQNVYFYTFEVSHLYFCPLLRRPTREGWQGAGMAVDSKRFIQGEHSFPSFLAAGSGELNLAGLRCRKPDSTLGSWIGNTGLNVFEVKIKP